VKVLEIEITELNEVEAEEEFAKSGQKGKWKELIERVEEEETSFKVTGLKRGQIAALYRSAKNAGLKVKTSYKDGYAVLSPGE